MDVAALNALATAIGEFAKLAVGIPSATALVSSKSKDPKAARTTEPVTVTCNKPVVT